MRTFFRRFYVASCTLIVCFTSTIARSELISSTEQIDENVREEISSYLAGMWLDTNRVATVDFVMRNWKCDTKLLERADPIWHFLVKVGFMKVRPKRVRKPGIKCQYAITWLDQSLIERSETLELKPGVFWIGLVKQEVLGYEQLHFGPGISKGAPCLAYARPILKNIELTNFARQFKDSLKRDLGYVAVEQPEVVGTLCGTPMADGSIRWSTYDRLR